MEPITLNELSLNVLDIALNSVRAGASYIRILVTVNTDSDSLKISIWDNGCGFDVKEYKRNRDFSSKKSGGKGLLLFKESAEKTGGDFYIVSKPGEGTFVTASYITDSPFCAPLGDMGETIAALALCENIRIVYTYIINGYGFSVDTEKISEILGIAPSGCPEAVGFIKEYIRDSTEFNNKRNF